MSLASVWNMSVTYHSAKGAIMHRYEIFHGTYNPPRALLGDVMS
jgi:hypothetical protein